MNRVDPKQNGIRDLICLAAILSLVITFFVRYANRPHKEKAVAAKAILLPYRTINTPGDTSSLYAYELHTRKVQQDELQEYCVVIRNVVQAKDNYKAYCKAVVQDIVKATGSDKVAVYIYDNYEAYDLYESKFLAHFQNLDTAESTLVAAHLVATYIGDRANGYCTSHQFSFYENAHDHRTETESYSPATITGNAQ
jgi:hypothetical protein